MENNIENNDYIKRVHSLLVEKLGVHKEDNIKYVCEHFEKNMEKWIERTVFSKEYRERLKYKTDEYTSDFIKKYAFYAHNFFSITNGEWYSINIDAIFENWCLFLKEKKEEDSEDSDDNRLLYQNRWRLFRTVKTEIRKRSILDQTPGSLLVRRTFRVFKSLGLPTHDLRYLFAFLGAHCLKRVNNHEYFSSVHHVWHGFKVYDVLSTLQRLVGTKIRGIRFKISHEYHGDFSNIVCLFFPHLPHDRRIFQSSALTLPLETKMVFTKLYREYITSPNNNIGVLQHYECEDDIYNAYTTKAIKSSEKELVYLDELFEDFKFYLYQKGIPRSLASVQKLKSLLDNKLSTIKEGLYRAQVACMTRHMSFKEFCGTTTSKPDLMSLHTIYKNYLEWCDSDTFTSRKHIKDFLDNSSFTKKDVNGVTLWKINDA
tara:strand:- start:686 stop:1972 length:1287 start_codon:yes stop_codon:yes gene_type:complete